MMFWLEEDYIRFDIDDRHGLMHKDYVGVEMTAYLEWVAEGNTAEEWTGN
jgi:hypothetical protein